MNKLLLAVRLLALLVCLSVLWGCAAQRALVYPTEPTPVEQMGQVPEVFQEIISNNLFHGVTAFDGRLLKAEIGTPDPETAAVTGQIQMMDVYGNPLASYPCNFGEYRTISNLTATADGGFLFIVELADYRPPGLSLPMRVIKVGKDGALQFDTTLEGTEFADFRFCLEKDGKFYFFGEIRILRPETPGTLSPHDIYMTVLDQTGCVLKAKRFAGSNFDHLSAAETAGDTFLLSVSSQSDDGIFTGSDSNGYGVHWVFTLDKDLEIVKQKKAKGRDILDDRVGEKDGKPVYLSDKLLKNYDAGTVTAYIDYDDSYLIVSENNTGVYENKPSTVSSTWYYTETVYSLYDSGGSLLFRASADSSPDFSKPPWIDES